MGKDPIVGSKQIASNKALFPQGGDTTVGGLFNVLKANLVRATKEMGLNINPDDSAISGGPTSNELVEQNAPKPGEGGMNTGSFPGSNPDRNKSAGGVSGGSYAGTVGTKTTPVDSGGSFPGYKPYQGSDSPAANDMGVSNSFSATPVSMSTPKVADTGQGFSMTGVETKLTDINGTLTQSLDIQKQMLAALQAMSGKAINSESNPSSPSNMKSSDPNLRSAVNQTRPVAESVIDISRRAA
jgi:hypothetical protein